jgi:hypothetical protein
MSNLNQFFAEICKDTTLIDFIREYIDNNLTTKFTNIITPDFDTIYQIFENLNPGEFKPLKTNEKIIRRYKYFIINNFIIPMSKELMQTFNKPSSLHYIIISPLPLNLPDCQTILTHKLINTNYDITKILNYFAKGDQIDKYFDCISNNNIQLYNILITFFKNLLYGELKSRVINFVTPKFDIIFNLLANLQPEISFELWEDINKFATDTISKYVVINAFKMGLTTLGLLDSPKNPGVCHIIISKSQIKFTGNNTDYQIITTHSIDTQDYFELEDMFNFIVTAELKPPSPNLDDFINELSDNNPKNITIFLAQYYTHTLDTIFTNLIGNYSDILDLINLKLSINFKLWKSNEYPSINLNDYVIINCEIINIDDHMNFIMDKIKTLNIKFILISNFELDLYNNYCKENGQSISIKSVKNKYNLSGLYKYVISKPYLNQKITKSIILFGSCKNTQLFFCKLFNLKEITDKTKKLEFTQNYVKYELIINIISSKDIYDVMEIIKKSDAVLFFCDKTIRSQCNTMHYKNKSAFNKKPNKLIYSETICEDIAKEYGSSCKVDFNVEAGNNIYLQHILDII